MKFESKPYTVPNDDAPDETFVRVYWQDILREPRLLYGLRSPDGTPYLRSEKWTSNTTKQ